LQGFANSLRDELMDRHARMVERYNRINGTE